MVKVSSLALAGLAQASYASAAPYLFEQENAGQQVLGMVDGGGARLDKVDPLRRKFRAHSESVFALIIAW